MNIRNSSAILVFLLVPLIFAASAMAALQDENLLTPLPKGFKLGWQNHNSQQQFDMVEYVPQTETVDNWSRMLTVQIAHALKNYDVNNFAGGIGKQWKTACMGSDVHKVTSGNENGYAFSVWAYSCPLNTQTGKPENMWLKAISGKDSLYIVQYAYRLPLQNDLAVEAGTYLRTVSVCDTRDPSHACPKGI